MRRNKLLWYLAIACRTMAIYSIWSGYPRPHTGRVVHPTGRPMPSSWRRY